MPSQPINVLVTCKKSSLGKAPVRRKDSTVVAEEGTVNEIGVPIIIRAEGVGEPGEWGAEKLKLPGHLIDPGLGKSAVDWEWVIEQLCSGDSTDPVKLTPPGTHPWCHTTNAVHYKWRKTVESTKTVKQAVSWIAVLLIDALVGYFMCNMIDGYTDSVEWYVNTIREVAVGYVRWIEGWPAGFKGNTELNRVLGRGAEWAVSIGVGWVGGWGWVGSWVGCSVLMAMVADMWMIVGAPFVIGYLVYGKLFGVSREVLVQLAGMMRGKKFNPLRRKTDSHHFDAHQKLLCTVVFTLATFLFPTITVYHLFFLISYTTLRAFQETITLIAHLLLTLPYLPFLLHPISAPPAPSWHVSSVTATPTTTTIVLKRNRSPIGSLFSETSTVLRQWIDHGPARYVGGALGKGKVVPITAW